MPEPTLPFVLAAVVVVSLNAYVLFGGADFGDGVKDTYVQPHQRTSPNSSRTDNYGYPGNVNPNSGQITPSSNSPRENYPSNPNPYGKPSSGLWK